MDSLALVCEGGGMRGLYTGGVLDVFLDTKIHFPYCIGVSAGASYLFSYVSNQRGRNWQVNGTYAIDKRYLSYRNLLKTGSIFGMDFIFKEIPNNLVPFDYEAFNAFQGKMIVGCTDCKTGKPVYFNDVPIEKEEAFKHIQASCSLPLLSTIQRVENLDLLDGGIADPIPIEKAFSDGAEKAVVVLTRPAGYSKKPSKGSALYTLKYGKNYPGIVSAMERRHRIYNETLERLSSYEQEGKVFIIRPSRQIDVSRLEKNQQVLKNLYDLGMHDATALMDSLKDFLAS